MSKMEWRPAPAFRTEVTLTEAGALRLDDLPFDEGDHVEVIVLAHPLSSTDAEVFAGTPLRYERPSEPIFIGEGGNPE